MASKADIVRELVYNNPSTIMRVFDAITRVVAESFVEDRRASSIVLLSAVTPSQAEITRRSELCYDWFIRLRADLHYSTTKALDYLPRALRSTLDGVDYEPPPATNSWGSGV